MPAPGIGPTPNAILAATSTFTFRDTLSGCAHKNS